MRYELRLILWVTAVGLLAAAVWRGFWADADLPLEEVVATATTKTQVEGQRLEVTSRSNLFWVGRLPNVDPQQRPMFKPVPSAPLEIVTGNIEVRPVELPMLKGIVDQAGRRAAVFSRPNGSLPYSLASVGEQVEGYTLVTIESERVVAKSGGGDPVIFKLRGAGELP